MTMLYRVRLPDHASFEDWRPLARQCFLAGLQPHDVEWCTTSEEATLFDLATTLPPAQTGRISPVLRNTCLALLKSMLRHASKERFALAYRILCRAQQEPALASITVDPDIAQALRMDHQVRRDAHKMKAFVRFRECGANSENNRRNFLAWFEPDHYILSTVASFFTKRFTDMDWVILTPKGSIAWNGDRCALSHEPCDKASVEDQIDALWQTYYVSIFNPARIKTKAMRSEMPRKYWKNLPETQLIPQMLANAEKRVAEMAAQQPKAPPKFHTSLQKRAHNDMDVSRLKLNPLQPDEGHEENWHKTNKTELSP